MSSNGDQRVPSIGGFISSTGSVPEKETTIDYYKTLHRPITQHETVQELLQQSEEATKAVCEKYAINIFDLGVCMEALPLIWTFPDKFKEHFVIPGPSHTEVNFIGMLSNQKMQDLGILRLLRRHGLSQEAI